MFFLQIFSLYIPLLVSIVFISLALMIRRSEEQSVLTFSIIGFDLMQVGIPTPAVPLLRLGLVALATITLTTYAFRDFSSFFPELLRMDVFFDDQGLTEAVQIFSESEREMFGIIEDYEPYRKEYYTRLNNRINEVVGIEDFFTETNQNIHSFGETIFTFDKIVGLHQYHINEVRGRLVHVKEQAYSQPITFVSYFEKIDSKYDRVEPTLVDVFVRGQVVIRPRFKQTVANLMGNETTVSFDHELHGITKVYSYPYPHYSWTLYCWVLEDVGLIPIGYAIYRER